MASSNLMELIDRRVLPLREGYADASRAAGRLDAVRRKAEASRQSAAGSRREVIAYFKAGGAHGWQTRINERLRRVAMAAGEAAKGRGPQKPSEGQEASLTQPLSIT